MTEMQGNQTRSEQERSQPAVVAAWLRHTGERYERELLASGWDEEYGGIFYFLDADGRPRPELEWDMKLWWVHNEALLACLHAYRASENPQFLEWFKRIDEWIWQHFPDPEHGEWFGYLNRQGQVTHSFKGSRWKSPFHLARCLLLGSQLLGELADVAEKQE